jgi:PAS domain S-box-containing protein
MTSCSSHDHAWPPEDSNGARHDAGLYQRIAVLEQQARSLEVEKARRERAEQMLREREQMLLECSTELLNSNKRLELETGRRQQAEAALLKAQLVLTSVERTAHLGSWEFDENTGALQCSDEFFRICGLAPQSVKMSLDIAMSLVHADDRNAARKAVRQTRRHGKHYTIEKRIVRPDGEIRYVISRGEPVFENGRLAKVVGSFIDVTEQQLAQQALVESEGRFRSLVNLSSDWYWEQDENMRFTTLLRHGAERAGTDTGHMLGHTPWEVGGASWKETEKQSLMNAVALRRPFHDFEYAYRSRGAAVSLQISGEPVYNAAGRFTGYRGIGKDVTERVKREKELYLFRSAMDATSDAVFLFDGRGRPFFDVNAIACAMLGYTREELLRRTPESFGARTSAQLDWLYDEGTVPDPVKMVETWLERKDGSRLLVEIERRRLQWDNAWITVVVARDITKRKCAEQALRESREALRGLAAHQQRIKEEERKNIAREVHDELGGLLSCIKAYVSVAIDNAVENGAQPDRLLVDAADLADTAIETVRRVIAELRPSVLDDLGIWAALEWYANQINSRTDIRCICTIDAGALELDIDPERSTMLFRVVQEALTNVVRHAEADRVEIRVARQGGAIAVEVQDDGKGIAPDRLINKESFGVLGMHERAAYFGAELKITGAPGQGTLVALTLPWGPAHG